MKRFLFVALMLLITSPLYAAAATFSMTGDYYVEGKWWGNYNLDKYEKATVRYIDQEINLYPKIQVGNTVLNLRIDLAECVWGGPEALDRSDYAANVKGLDQFQTGDGRLVSNDANINIERAYISHKFNDTFTLDIGLQDGGGWGTDFGNSVYGQWRIKLAQNTKLGTFLYYYEKPANLSLDNTAEQGDTTGVRNGEEDDTENFYFGYIKKFGPITVKNLLGYSYGSSADLNNDNQGLFTWAETLALSGNLGVVSFESEFSYKRLRADYSDNIATPAALRDVQDKWAVYGGYINVWKDLGTMTPGFLVAYGSFDDSAPTARGFDFGANFNTTPIFGDQLGLGGGKDLFGMTAYKLYVNDIQTPVKPLTLSAFAAYIVSNQKTPDANTTDANLNNDVSYFKGLTGWEAGIGGAYQITENLVYNAWTSYGKAQLSSEYKNYAATLADPADARNLSHDPDAMYLLAHSLTLSF